LLLAPLLLLLGLLLLPAALHHSVLQDCAVLGARTGLSCAGGLCWLGCRHPVLQGLDCCLGLQQLQHQGKAGQQDTSEEPVEQLCIG
jgi:hypothetical protein